MVTKAAVQKKSSGSSKLKAAAQKVKDYKQALQDAYDRGYGDGYAAATDIPKVVGAKMAAKTGYSRGLRDNGRGKKDKTKAAQGKSRTGKREIWAGGNSPRK